MIKIACPIAPKTGISFFRMYQPLIALQYLYPKEFSVSFFPIGKFGEAFENTKYDVYYSCAPPILLDLQIDICKKYGVKVVLDYDDAPAQYVLPSNQCYVYTGDKECNVEYFSAPERAYKWVDGVTERMIGGKPIIFNIKRNKEVVDKMRDIRSKADMIITPSDNIKELLINEEGLKMPIKVIDNAVNFSEYKCVPRISDGHIRIGWVMGHSHLDDWFKLEPFLGEIADEFPNVKYVFMSQSDIDAPNIRDEQIEVIPAVNIDNGYFNLFSNLQLDIGIAHVEDNTFNRCKSKLKFYEYSAAGVASIVSNTLYGEVAKDGETAMVYNCYKDFKSKLRKMIKSSLLRTDIASNAYDFTMEYKSIEAIIPEYKKALEELCR